MATLTFEIPRSTRIDLGSPRPATTKRPVMELPAARDLMVVSDLMLVSGRRRAVVGGVSGEQYAPAAPCGPSNGLSRSVFGPAAAINQSKSITSTDEGVITVDLHDGMGAFATRLGSRPPSPPV